MAMVRNLSDRQRAWMYLGGGVALVVGSFMTWIKVTVIFIGTVTVAGIDGDGKATAAAGVVIAAGGWFVLRGEGKAWLDATAVLAAVGALATGLHALSQIPSTEVSVQGRRFGTVSVGFGLYVTLLAAGVSLFGALASLRSRSAPAQSRVITF